MSTNPASVATPAPCACSRTRHDLRLVEDEIEDLRQALREGDEQARVEIVRLALLRDLIEARLTTLAPV